MGGPGSGPRPGKGSGKWAGKSGGHRKGNQKENLARALFGKKGTGKNARTSLVKSRKVSSSGKLRGFGGRGKK